MSNTAFFNRAVPIWADSAVFQKNATYSFSAVLAPAGEPVALNLTASSLYRFFVNGKFAGYGPARGPHGYARVDSWDLTSLLTEPENTLVIEVAGYRVNSYYTIDQPSFLWAEVVKAGIPVLSTGLNDDFLCRPLPRVEKVQRYSFQRPFTEYWKLGVPEAPAVPVRQQAALQLLDRGVPYPEFDVISAAAQIDEGWVTDGHKRDEYWRDRSLVNIGETLKGYPMEKLEICLTDEVQEMDFSSDSREQRTVLPTERLALPAGSYRTFSLGHSHSGFIGLHLSCKQPTRIYLLFDEILTDGEIDPLRFSCANVLRYDLQSGNYDLLSMECYTLQYLKVVVLDGDAVVSDVFLREYAAPLKQLPACEGSKAWMSAVFDAAIETYRQNAVDLFTDCPSRERAGWLCDSFFTGRVEYLLTGENKVEHNFLENFVLPDSFAFLPEGMLPMCYPADHYDGVFIPNWALWLILELREYLARTGDRKLIDDFRPKIEKLLRYFEQFLNEDGLLENLDGWIFVEWSKANELIQDVNYPTNMLYAAALEAAGELYEMPELVSRSADIRKTVRRQSLDGMYFIDNAVRRDGKLVLSGEKTEVCQYYAFYFHVATPDTDPELWHTLVREFGPERKEHNTHPDVHFANAFIGYYLRLELLERAGLHEEVLRNIEGFFTEMAKTTGTLWEKNSATDSLCHGFASHVLCWMLPKNKK